MENKTKLDVLKKQNGQSTVEYILVLAILFSVGIAVLKSDTLKEMLGEDSTFFNNYRRQMEFSYRHGSPLDLQAGVTDESSYSGFHETYYSTKQSQSRFFLSETSYPNE